VWRKWVLVLENIPSFVRIATDGAVGVGGEEVPIPDDAVWIKCYDPTNAAFYYLHSGTQESVWEVPSTDDFSDGVLVVADAVSVARVPVCPCQVLDSLCHLNSVCAPMSGSWCSQPCSTS
jgi:hypothetical protein